MLPIEADSGVAEKLLDKTSLQLRSCEVDGRVLEALLISVPEIAIMCLFGIPALDQTVMAVALTLWLV